MLAHGHDESGVMLLKVLYQKPATRVLLLVGWGSIVSALVNRVASYGIGYPIFPLSKPQELQRLVQLVSRRSHERQSLLILFKTGRFTDEPDPGLRVAPAHYYVPAGPMQPAPLAQHRLSITA